MCIFVSNLLFFVINFAAQISHALYIGGHRVTTITDLSSFTAIHVYNLAAVIYKRYTRFEVFLSFIVENAIISVRIELQSALFSIASAAHDFDHCRVIVLSIILHGSVYAPRPMTVHTHTKRRIRRIA